MSRAYITTEKKRQALDKLWRTYDRLAAKEKADPMKRDHGSHTVRAEIEDFVNRDTNLGPEFQP